MARSFETPAAANLAPDAALEFDTVHEFDTVPRPDTASGFEAAEDESAAMATAVATAHPRNLIIACGAIAAELVAVVNRNGLDAVRIQCLPAEWHNRPERITPGIRKLLEEHHEYCDHIFIAYGDCGTGGLLDALLEEYPGVERLPGDHCYSFFAGSDVFETLSEEELASFYLTDYLARNFERLIIKGFGLDRHPELMDMMFGNYKRMVYLAQTEPPARLAEAEAAAVALNLPLVVVNTGLAPFTNVIPIRNLAHG
ncbi:MAG: hypothetical protein CSB44_09390 [Gammaproteobacteria bacterium]|nr:MAG: hypothetical protein CSB44_09390 [Gammaproteobacteria bacterium]